MFILAIQSIVFQSVNLHVCLVIVCIIFQRLGGHPANWQHTLNEETRKRIRKREYDLGGINSEKHLESKENFKETIETNRKRFLCLPRLCFRIHHFRTRHVTSQSQKPWQHCPRQGVCSELQDRDECTATTEKTIRLSKS